MMIRILVFQNDMKVMQEGISCMYDTSEDLRLQQLPL